MCVCVFHRRGVNIKNSSDKAVSDVSACDLLTAVNPNLKYKNVAYGNRDKGSVADCQGC